MEINDKLIYNRFKNGDEEAYNAIFNKYYLRLCLFSNKLINDIDKARSLVQEVFVDFWIEKDSINIRTSLKSYLFLAVKNSTLDYLRHLKVESNYLTSSNGKGYSEETIQDIMEQSELNQKINEAIDKLPNQCKTVFKLSKLDGLKYAEIAEKLNLSVKTIEMHMGSALKKLRSELSDIHLILFSIFKKGKRIKS